MPYEWITAPPQTGQAAAPPAIEPTESPAPGAPDSLLAELHLWPYRSLPRVGFVWFIGITAALIALPLFNVLGTPELWALLPFLIVAVGAIWLALNRSYRDGELLEVLRIWPERIELLRHNPRKPRQEWTANPYWVSLQMHDEGGPVEHYLTLKGAGREVEIGAFLSPDEREALHDELALALNRCLLVNSTPPGSPPGS